MATIDISADDLSFALDCAISMLDGMDDEEVEEFFGGTLSPTETEELTRRLQAAYGTIRA